MGKEPKIYNVCFRVSGYAIWIGAYCKAWDKSQAVQFMCVHPNYATNYILCLNRTKLATERDFKAIEANKYEVYDATTRFVKCAESEVGP